MKRADDFAKFVEKTHTLGESLAFQPETPEDCDIDYLARIEKEKPIAENPYEPSTLRKGGLKIWDSVYIPLPEKVALNPKRSKDLSSLRGINTEWETVTKKALGMIGRPDGVHYLRPKGKFILDLLNDDIRILQGAHILTHRSAAELAHDDWTFGETANLFFRNLVKLFISRKYSLQINVHPTEPVQDAFDLYGIEIFGSTALRSPVLVAGIDGDESRLTQDRSVIALLGSVGVESCPQQASEGTLWKEVNKWSCLPTLVALAGWECVDYITHAEKTEARGSLCHAVPCADLQEMKDFQEVLDLAIAARGRPGTGPHIYQAEAWFDSDDFKKGLAETPQLPCPHCLRLNREAKGIVPRPMSRKPRKTFKEVSQMSYPEAQEWVKYATFMRNCIEIGRKATAYASGSPSRMRKRNKAFKSKAETQRKIASLEKKYARKAANGYVTEAEILYNQIEQLKGELNK